VWYATIENTPVKSLKGLPVMYGQSVNFNPDQAIEFRRESRKVNKDWRSRTIFTANIGPSMVRIKMGGSASI